MNLGAAKRTIARTTAVLDERTLTGTAFLVTRRLALTCAHCLGSRDASATQVTLRFSVWETDARDVTAVVVYPDWDLDVALLELDTEAPVEVLAPLPGGAVKGAWTSFGHPAQVEDDGLVLSGNVLDADARAYGKSGLLQLDCTQGDTRVRGASGSPIIIDGRIAGLITNQLLEYVETAQGLEATAAFKTLYARRLDGLRGVAGFARLAAIWQPTHEQRLIAAAVERGRGTFADRVRNSKYRRERYVEREALHRVFNGFLAQSDTKCFLVIGKAGAGKTTALSSLALGQPRGPMVFFLGGVDRYDREDVKKAVEQTLIDAGADPGTLPRSWDELMAALRTTGHELMVFIDAINETAFSMIQERRGHLQRLLEFASTQPIRVIVSCRDVFWTYFVNEADPSNDFWWSHVFDPTLASRREAERQRRLAALAAQPASSSMISLGGDAHAEIERAAEQVVERYPSFVLGDFTQGELDAALQRYGLDAGGEELPVGLRHPLLLQLYSELTMIHPGDAPRTQGALLGRYLDHKLGAVRDDLRDFPADAGKKLLARVTAAMRAARHGRISVTRLDELIGDDRDLDRVRKHVLDEGIILELREIRGERMIGFQFDALFEYALSRLLADELLAAPSMEVAGAALIAEAAEFESLAGALEYLCVDLEVRHPAVCKQLLAQLARANTFGRHTVLRIAPQLWHPMHADFEEPLLAALGDREVRDSIAVEALVKVLHRDATAARRLGQLGTTAASDFVGVRCAKALHEAAALPVAVRVDLAKTLLQAASFDIAAAATSALRELFEAEPAQLAGLIDFLVSGDIAFTGLLRIVEDVLPGLVPHLGPGQAAAVLQCLFHRAEFMVDLHIASMRQFVEALLKHRSMDVLELGRLGNTRSSSVSSLGGLVIHAVIAQSDVQDWAIEQFARQALEFGKALTVGGLLLANALQLAPGRQAWIEAIFSTADVARIWKLLGKLGYHRSHGHSGADWSLTIATGVFAGATIHPAVEHWLDMPIRGMTFGGLVEVAGTSLLALLLMLLQAEFIRPRGTWAMWLAASAFTTCGIALKLIPSFAVSLALCITACAVGIISTAKTNGPKGVLALLASYPAPGLTLVAPAWLIGKYAGWDMAILVVGVALAVTSRLNFYLLAVIYAGASTWTVGRSALFVLAIRALRTDHALYVISLAAAVMTLYAIASVFVRELHQGTMRGFLGRPLVVIAAIAVVVSALLIMLGLWPLATPIVAATAVLLLPISDWPSWRGLRLTSALEWLIFGVIAGVAIWWQWSWSDGVPALFELAVWWMSLNPLLFVAFAYLGARAKTAEFRHSLASVQRAAPSDSQRAPVVTGTWA